VSHFYGAVKKIRDQSKEMETQSKRIKLQSEEITKLKFELSSRPIFNGTLLWEIPNFPAKLKTSKNTNETLCKHLFAMDGYKLKVHLSLNGDFPYQSNISVYISLVPGPFDDALGWPMKAIISLSAEVDGVERHKKTFQTDQTDETRKTYSNPSVETQIGRGYSRFIPHSQIPPLLVDGKLTLKISAKPKL